jgi:hypothetical protein
MAVVQKNSGRSTLGGFGNTVMHVCLRELLHLSARYSDNSERSTSSRAWLEQTSSYIGLASRVSVHYCWVVVKSVTGIVWKYSSNLLMYGPGMSGWCIRAFFPLYNIKIRSSPVYFRKKIVLHYWQVSSIDVNQKSLWRNRKLKLLHKICFSYS